MEQNKQDEQKPVAKPSGKVIWDEDDVYDPFAIIATLPPDDESESGWVLNWKNPRLRNGGAKGWDGWQPIEFGDKYAGENGEKLIPFIPNAPRRMVGPDRIDNLVRRADTVLARLPKHVWERRQQKAVLESQEAVKGLQLEEGAELLPGVESLGEGRKRDKNPTFGKGTPGDQQLARKLRQT